MRLGAAPRPVRGIRISNWGTAWHCSSTKCRMRNAAGEARDGTTDLSVVLNFRVHSSMPKPVLPGYLCGSPVRVAESSQEMPTVTNTFSRLDKKQCRNHIPPLQCESDTASLSCYWQPCFNSIDFSAQLCCMLLSFSERIKLSRGSFSEYQVNRKYGQCTPQEFLKSNACAVKLCEYELYWGHCQHILLQNGHYFAISLDFALSSSNALQSSEAEHIAWTLFS